MEALVIGAGVIGLAIGRALAVRGHDVIVAEAEAAFGTGISSRSSEVIHAGMYYPPGSLRARHCVAGARLLYAFCNSHGVPHRACGKLIVATSEEERPAIEAIHARGLTNGVEGLRLITSEEARRLEPNLACVAAIDSAATGIVDSHGLMLALLGDLEDAGGALALNTPIEAASRKNGRWSVKFGGDTAGTLDVDLLVNAAGLGAQRIAHAIAGYPESRVPRQALAKGRYFGCLGKPAFSRLIYPAPVEGGLGIHLTLDLSGRMRFGPDVAWIEAPDYEVEPELAPIFEHAIRRYWPGLPSGRLTPDYAGIRPKLTGPGEPAADFVIDGPAEHALPGVVQLFGIESPGLTSALSIAEEVADRLD